MLQPSKPRKAEIWPPNYVSVFAWRQEQLLRIRDNPALLAGAKEYYRTRPVEFIEHWVDTYDPRNAGRDLPTRLPLVLFDRQKDLVAFLLACLEGEADGLIEKARDMGATWVCCAFSVWLWLFWPGVSVGWGSRKEQLVDKIGDADSIFEKMRLIVRGLPPQFRPAGLRPDDHMTYMKFINPENGATITGEAGDNIGRGGRKRIYFKDESAHYERPEKIEAALADNTRCQIDISSVNGLGNVFHRKRQTGKDWEPGDEPVKDRANVFVMGWQDHPAKSRAWYEERKAKAVAGGLLHIFAQEVDRSYAASLEGVIIPNEWLLSCFDAHKKLGFDDSGGWGAALDVADSGLDRNAFAAKKGVVLKRAAEWGERDTGVTARRTVGLCEDLGRVDVQYDCIGVGSGVKAEVNRLKDEDLLPAGIRFIPWDAGSGPKNPEDRVNGDDPQSPLNKDFYGNFKAQGWWELRLRVYRTHQAVTEGVSYPVDQLISIDTESVGPAMLRKIEEELCQPVAGKSARLKTIVEKAPEGTRSPNIGDAVMMAYWPADSGPLPLEDWV